MIKNEDGQSLVEFALILPILLMLVVGIFDFGRVLYTHLQLELITQESVRIAGLGQGDEAVRTYAQNNFDIGELTDLGIDISPEEPNRSSGEYVTVTLTYPEEFLNVLGDAAIPYTVKTSSTIRVE
ncbi:TadE/TadG family type IV pilus assembly protein [Virgibacillus salinus]|uniref:TadE-like protein n=1 Tax=Virgibacillus salinus TaxID=553311 RepID=A0A1H0Z6L3_9BACI|nr:TadE/TadG family type IV pilus assembly protein [Virgibacillus salinus]SDQ23034.1 TadE-like protein [Virgibacillus salinus]